MSAGVLALIAAALFALGVVLQQRGAMAAPSAGTSGFLSSILRNPVWLAGGLAQAGGWFVQALALNRGQLFVVQPIVALQVVFALPLGVVITGQTVHRREWLGAIAVVVGLAVLLGVSNPESGRDSAPTAIWLAAGIVVFAAAAALALVGRHREAAARAMLFGTAAGIVFGFQAAVTKAFTEVVPQGLDAILGSWTTYALIASALGGFYFAQISLQAGVLAPAVATTNVANPVTSVLLGRIIFLEKPARSTGGTAVAILALVLLVGGLIAVSGGEAAAQARAAPSPG